MDNIFMICFGGIFYIGAPLLVVMGVNYLYLAFKNPKKAKESLEWPTVDGKLTLVHQLGKTGMINNLDLRYDYIYKGEKYTGKDLTLYPNMFFGKDSIEEIKQTYHEGDTVTVYVNPNKPQKAILQTDLQDLTKYYTVWGSLNLVLGIFLLAVILSSLLG